MTNLKGTKTEANLQTALCGESTARNKYTYFAKKARKDGYVQIGDIFEETANNEKEHAKIWFKLLYGINSTEKNLQDSLDTEQYESDTMYPEFARTAKEEGFDDIADLFEKVSKIEKFHQKRFEHLLNNIENKKVFNSDSSVIWECAKCGYSEIGTEAPKECPVCGHKQEYFMKRTENY